MRLAIDVRPLLDEAPSGVVTYTNELVRAMLRVAPGHDYHVFYNSWRSAQLPTFSPEITVHAFHYPNKALSMSQFSVGYPRWDRWLAADCFFAPSLRLMPLTGTVPLVATAHDVSFEYFPEFLTWRRRLWHRMMQPRSLYRLADHVIAVSHTTARDVSTLYDIPADKISVVHSGVTADEATPSLTAQNHVRAKYNLPTRFILAMGTMEPRKNIASVVRAYEAIASRVPHDLVIAGPPGWLMKEPQELIAHSVVHARVHRPGVIAEADKAAVLAAADVFVYPSFYEGFGFPPLEALLAGTPVITSYNSALPEVVGEWATLIDPYQPGELAAVLDELLHDLPKVDPEVRRRIREKYSWDRAARATLRVMEKVV